MRVPPRLETLLERGTIDAVLRPLQSGKEAAVFVVVYKGEECVAKVYKEADDRTFRHRSAYTEGRRVRNSRKQRAMSKKSRYGREELEAAWRDAEVDAIYRCRAADVRVPIPYEYVDGVLVMEMIRGPNGEPAPRLVDESFRAREARDIFDKVLREVVKMLCAGVVHGDLSDFNILLSAEGPVIIDFPQWLDAAHNRNARRMLIRDVDNLQQFLGRYARGLKGRRFGKEMWQLFERNELRPDTVLTGKAASSEPAEDPYSLLREIEELEKASRERREKLGLPMRPARQPVAVEKKNDESEDETKSKSRRRRRRRRRRSSSRSKTSEAASDTTNEAPAPKKRPPGGASSADHARGGDFDDLDALLTVGSGNDD